MERSLEPLCDMIGIRIFFPGKAIVYIGSADGSLVPVVREARPEDDLLVQGIRQDTDCLLYTSICRQDRTGLPIG